jgi:tetratricopeptide (TPR) repeat protein
VAIQFAWGLHCVHELGLVHQDVKPGNVLMGRDKKVAVQGVKPRLTDYGLARARAAAGERYVPDPGRSSLVSNGGGTPAFWSPEQAQGLALTRQTDIWSWGVSVLEMFMGQVSWRSGDQAPEHLERYLQHSACDKATPGRPAGVAAWLRQHFRPNPPERPEGIPAMPASAAALLRECLRQNPAERLPSLTEAVHRLKAIYRRSVGTRYSRSLEPIERARSPQAGVNERRDLRGASWNDPQLWLERALQAAGRDPAEAGAIVTRRGVTRRGELVAELAVYDEAKRLYERLVRDGRKELEEDLARLCTDKALVHATAADSSGLIREHDQAIAIRERLVNQEGRRELANDLARAYFSKANALSDLGEHRAAVALYDQAIAIRERLVNQEGRRDLVDDLAQMKAYRRDALSKLG